MKIYKFSEFSINEGRISQFFIRKIFKVIDLILTLSKRIKGKKGSILYFKDRSMEKELNYEFAILVDSMFDMAKVHLSKKFRNAAMKSSFSELVEERTGTNLYQLVESIMSKLKEENLNLSTDNSVREEQILYLERNIKSVSGFKSLIKKLDDDLAEEKEIMDTLEKVLDSLRSMSPSDDLEVARNKMGDLADLTGSVLDKKNLDALLDKVAQYGMDSLTDKEKTDLDKWSQSV